MSFAGLLGAGLLGGAGNAAKSAGDRIREEAKQKREMLLQDRADARASEANDNAVEAATQRRIFDAQQNRINNAALINRDNNSGRIRGDLQNDQQDFTGGQNDANRTQRTDLQNDQQAFTSGQNADNNAAALERVGAAKVGNVESFYNTEGLVYRAEKQEDGSWKAIGGAKAPDATTRNAITLQTSYDTDGREVKGYMNGNTWVTVGGPKADSKTDANGAPKSGWTEKSATDYFTKQAYDQLGIKVSDLGVILGDVSETDFAKARKWIAVATDRYTGTGNVESPGAIVAEVFNDEYHALQAPTESVKASAMKAINSGVNKASVRSAVEAKGFDSSFLN